MSSLPRVRKYVMNVLGDSGCLMTRGKGGRAQLYMGFLSNGSLIPGPVAFQVVLPPLVAVVARSRSAVLASIRFLPGLVGVENLVLVSSAM